MSKLVQKLTYCELVSAFEKHNREHDICCGGKGKLEDAIDGVIVYSPENWDKPYPLESRSYEVSSYNKAFMEGCGGYSIFGSALDGSDVCVRLEHTGWKVEYCYLKEA